MRLCDLGRAAFVNALGVTHILVDSTYYEGMRRVLEDAPGQFRLRYANAGWAVYEVLPVSLAGSHDV